MKTFRFIGMALLAIVMCVNFASCSSDNDEESNGGKSTQELLQGVWYDAYTDDCPYFIVEKGYCYFANQPSQFTMLRSTNTLLILKTIR